MPRPTWYTFVGSSFNVWNTDNDRISRAWGNYRWKTDVQTGSSVSRSKVHRCNNVQYQRPEVPSAAVQRSCAERLHSFAFARVSVRDRRLFSRNWHDRAPVESFGYSNTDHLEFSFKFLFFVEWNLQWRTWRFDLHRSEKWNWLMIGWSEVLELSSKLLSRWLMFDDFFVGLRWKLV